MSIEYFIGSFIVICCAAYFFYRNGVKSRSAIAAAEFRKVFDPNFTINVFSKRTTSEFENVFIAQKEAIRIFRPYVSIINLNSFNKTWENYDKWANPILHEGLHSSDGIYGLTLGHEKRDINAEFKNHIESLLKFAKQT